MSGVGVVCDPIKVSDEIYRQVTQLERRGYRQHQFVIYVGFDDWHMLMRETPSYSRLVINPTEWHGWRIFRTERPGVHVVAE